METTASLLLLKSVAFYRKLGIGYVIIKWN